MKRQIKKTIALTLTLLMVIVTMAGCQKNADTASDAGSAKPLQKITLNEVAHSIFYAPMYVAIEEGYFADEGLDVTLVTGFGADKTMTAVLTGEADIGFMGSEATIYTYAGGAKDYVVNFAQLTQRAGNFLVARKPIENFDWNMLKGTTVLGGRAGGMPQMVFEFILEKNGIDPKADLSIDQSIDFGSTAAAFSGGQGDFSVESMSLLHHGFENRQLFTNSTIYHLKNQNNCSILLLWKKRYVCKPRWYEQYCKKYAEGFYSLSSFLKFETVLTAPLLLRA